MGRSGINSFSILNRIVALVLIVLVYIRSSYFSDLLPELLYYVVIAFVNVYLILIASVDKITYNRDSVLLYAVCLTSLVVGWLTFSLEPQLNSVRRLLIFILVFNVIGPLFHTPTTLQLRKYLFNYIMWSYPLVFFANFVYLIILKNIDFVANAGLHESPNLMGVTSGLAVLWFALQILKNPNKGFKIILYSGILLSLPLLLISASRAAFLSTGLSLLFIFILWTKSKLRLTVGLSTGLIIVLVFFGQVLSPFMEVMKAKAEVRANQDITGGRAVMYKDNLKDFALNPLLGVGFYNVVNKEKTKINSDGSLEYPSGWLFILASTGLLGFRYFYKLIKEFVFQLNQGSSSHLVDRNSLVFLVFFFIHSNFEGYIYSAGGLLFFLFWVTVSRFKISLYI